MSYFKAKMHQIRFRLTPLGSSQRSPDPLAGFKGQLRTSLGGIRRPEFSQLSCQRVFHLC